MCLGYLGIFALTASLLFTGCNDAAKQRAEQEQVAVIHRLQSQVGELEHAVNSQRVENEILQEKMTKLTEKVGHSKAEAEAIAEGEVKGVLKKLERLEKNQEKLKQDLIQMADAHAQVTQNIHRIHDKIQECETASKAAHARLDEVAKLKNTLSSLNRYVQSRAGESSTTYRVRAGDTLEKIAKEHHISLGALRKANSLEKDTIRVGQELLIPSE